MAKNQIILCDTNIFINMLRGHEKTKIVMEKLRDENIALSIVSYAEVVCGTKKSDMHRIKTFFHRFTVIDIDPKISNTFKGIVLNYSYNQHIKIPDALIAAAGIALGLPLYTDNRKDFDFIPEIKLHGHSSS